MAANVFITSYSVAGTPGQHAYLIHDKNTDGDNNFLTNTHDVNILRGGAGINYGIPTEIHVLIERREDVTTSVDWDDLQVATNLTSVNVEWGIMWDFAATMGEANNPLGGVYHSDLIYLLGGANSNSVVNSLLNVAGMNFREMLPIGTLPSQFPGHMGLLDGSGDSNFTAYINPGLVIQEATDFYKRDGDDTITLEYRADIDDYAELELDFSHAIGDNHFTTVILENLAYTDVDVEYGNTFKITKGWNPLDDDLVRVKDFVNSSLHDNVAFEFTDVIYRSGTDNAEALDAFRQIKGSALDGQDGDDTLNGFIGNDILEGGDGNDILRGGAGSDILNGGAGDDEYFFGFGDDTTNIDSHDIITDTGGNDIIKLGAGVTYAGSVQAGDDLHVEYRTSGGSNFITVKDFFLTDPDLRVEKIVYSHGATIDLIEKHFAPPPPPPGITITGEDTTNEFGTVIGVDEVLNGTSGNDTIDGLAGDDILRGYGGNDTIYGGYGADKIYGGDGHDMLYGIYGDNEIHGGSGNDYIQADWGQNVIYGGDGDDHITGDYGGNTVYGGAGNDRIVATTGLQTLDGGSGFDTLDMTMYLDPIHNNHNITVNLATGSFTKGSISNFESVILGKDSTVYGSGNDERLIATTGDNHIYGAGGNDQLVTGDGVDYIDGGDGVDLAEYRESEFANNTVVVNLQTGVVTNDGLGNAETLLNVENIITSDRADTVTGSDADNEIYTSGEDDLIYGSGGKDLIHGGAELSSTSIGDTVDYSAFTQSITMLDNYSVDKDGDGVIDDTLIDIERVIGTDFDDEFHITDLNGSGLTIDAGEGNDTVFFDSAAGKVYFDWETGGGFGNFALYGVENFEATHGFHYQGNDNGNWMRGSSQDDWFYGGTGNDTFEGKGGSDTYFLSANFGQDSIYETDGGYDVIQFWNGVSRSDLNFERHGNFSLKISINGSNDEIIMGFFGESADNRVEAIEFENGDPVYLLSSIVFAEYTGTAAVGTAEDDIFFGNFSNDTFLGASGNDQLFGEAGNDTLDGGVGDDILEGGEGDDTLRSSEGNDTLDGGTGSNTVEFTGNVDLDLVTGSATVAYGANAYTQNITNFNTIILNGNGINAAKGTNDDETFYAASGSNTIEGREGFDTVDYSAATQGLSINHITGEVDKNGDGQVDDTLISIEHIIGTDLGDIHTTSSADDEFTTGLGNDTIIASDGVDVIDTQDGIDTIDYSANTQRIVVQQSNDGGAFIDKDDDGITDDRISNAEIFIGTNYNDFFFGTSAEGVKNTFDGGADGYDGVTYFSMSQGITINYASGQVDKDGDGSYDDTLISIEQIFGTNHGDTHLGSGLDDNIFGGQGNDVINGGNGQDILEGGNGNDALNGGDDNDRYLFNSGHGSDTITDTGGFNDVLHIGAGLSFANLNLIEEGNDLRLTFTGSNEEILIKNQLLDAANPIIETLQMDAGGTFSFASLLAPGITLPGTSGDDNLLGSAGNDTILGSLGSDTIDGGDGHDILNYSTHTHAISMQGAYSIDKDGDFVGDDGISNIEEIIATTFSDNFEGHLINRIYDGNDGFDSIFYNGLTQAITVDYTQRTIDKNADGQADDTLYSIEFISGTDHGDTHLGSSFGDNINGRSGNDFIFGNAGNDFIVGGGGNDYIDGGDGRDTADYYNAATGVVVNLLATDWEYATGHTITGKTAFDGDGGRDTLYNIEEIYGSQFDDYINGANGVSGTIYGEAGNDVIFGGDGNDNIYGGDGDDQITALGGNDTVYGDAGADTISGSGSDDTLYGGSGNDIVRGQAGQDTIYGDDGDDELRGYEDNDELHGGAGNDTIYGGQTVNDTYASDDVLYGDDGDDALWGLKGNDTLRGGAGNDVLLGGDGNDILYTSDGRDVMRGEDGADTFIFVDGATTADIIKDFNTSQGDALDISDLLTGYDSATDNITDFVQITESGNNSLLLVDADGGGDSFAWVATLQNVTGITDVTMLETNNNLIG